MSDPVNSDTVSSDTVGFTELDEQHPELLPDRTVLSLFSAGANDGGIGGSGTPANGSVGITVAGIPLVPGGGNAFGGPGLSANGS
ncbi:MAG: hypothetical protein ACRDRU_16730 [Pseudonocardiaceae bacterium]